MSVTNFPATPAEEVLPSDALIAALGVQPSSFVGQNEFDKLLVVDCEDTVRNLRPDFSRLREIPARGFMVTSTTDDVSYDFISRYFAPAFGIDEDPVTGSAHCCLGPYWAEQLGKSELKALQASARGGVVRMRVDGDRMLLKGEAVTVMCGEFVCLFVCLFD